MASDAIYISIKPEFVSLIEKQEKNYEFRKYVPRKPFKYLYVYTTLPNGKLEYIIEIDYILIYPQKIMENGIGNNEFNLGKKKSKYAYHIKHLYKLNTPLSLVELKKEYNFTPPQGYFYADYNKTLTNYINLSIKELIF
jgi:predicted transcriptional regulator